MRIKSLGLFVLFIVLSSPRLFSQDQFVREYRVGPKDLLEINVIGFTDLNKRYRVSEEGKINLPYLGDLDVREMTISELEKKLAAMLIEGKYLPNPQVSVLIVEYQSRRVFLLGAVVRPGPYELLGRLTLLRLISQAGGLTQGAGKEIIVMRQLPGGEKTSLRVSIDDLILRGDSSLDIPLMPDDIVSIPVDEMVTIYITGEVGNPGALTMKKSSIPTLYRAIAQAGGFSSRASKGGVIIKRADESGKETIIKVNVSDIIKGKEKDIQLQENDVVVVPEKFF